MSMTFPIHGQSREAVLAAMQAARQPDLAWQDGRVFSLVFHAGEEVSRLVKEAYALFQSENGLNPTAFPSLRRFEAEVIAMSARLLGGDDAVVGNMTSGGTESILLAMLTAREWARAHKPDVQMPEVVLPVTAHPAFDKAAHYFGLKTVHTPVTADFRADVDAMTQAITPNSVLLVGSAPAYPHGTVDPIHAIAALAQARGLLCHVDACVGGFMLPFVRKLGYPVPEFDFSVPGVTSISADLHKYGYAAKGASLILYRNRALRRHQLFATMDWPGGIYASPTLAGTRPGGAIAAAWAVVNHLGEAGYVALAREVMDTAVAIRQAVDAIPGIHVLGDPVMSVFAIGADRLDVYELGDAMGARGWHLDRQQFPPSLHVTVNYAHVGRAEAFIRDLEAAVGQMRKPNLRRSGNRLLLGAARLATSALPPKLVSRLTARAAALVGPAEGEGGLPARSAAMYGMLGSLPNRGDLREIVLDLVETFTQPPAPRKAEE